MFNPNFKPKNSKQIEEAVKATMKDLENKKDKVAEQEISDRSIEVPDIPVSDEIIKQAVDETAKAIEGKDKKSA